jgi:hypothetical protein
MYVGENRMSIFLLHIVYIDIGYSCSMRTRLVDLIAVWLFLEIVSCMLSRSVPDRVIRAQQALFNSTMGM